MEMKEKNKNEKTRLNINVDKRLKQEAKDTLEDLGLDLTTAVTLYLTQVVKKKRIPFEISTTTYYSVDEVAGKDWRTEIQDVEDEWE
ncbi:type II toxin-antitoxin system RelB/DinJ family antitoxin [Enterococcus sp.]|uniref:type II toxin-antitoxin system RelB/DinJ family antitoxin n=1 Tax=Enterococcus sp. TaxID=35783 RepID=UPI00290BE082|nr:type II toxin-antitoxin system RelB/DinJ family antitoxin [Enterococcus sp.]MDU5336785.1 type II toxin-antitoxin system RelB/DinJ family antitoxin [Enterococcus sp.]